MTSPKFSADELFAARAVYDRLGRGSASDEQSIAIALAKSHASGFAEGMKRAAEIVRDHDEVTNLRTGKRSLDKRAEDNLVGLAYLEAILSEAGEA